MSDFLGIDHVPFNYRLREARLRLGWSRRELARRVGMSPSQVGDYEALHVWPTHKAQDRIAQVLQDASEYLFPPEVGAALRGKSARTVTSVLPAEALSLGVGHFDLIGAGDPAESAERDEMRTLVNSAVEHLPKRQRQVIVEIFGLGDHEPRSLVDIAAEWGMTYGEVMGVRNKALRRLRHPRNSTALRDYA